MRVRRTQHITPSHAGQHDIVEITAAALDQARILEAGTGLA
jgi:hypothetical protein